MHGLEGSTCACGREMAHLRLNTPCCRGRSRHYSSSTVTPSCQRSTSAMSNARMNVLNSKHAVLTHVHAMLSAVGPCYSKRQRAGKGRGSAPKSELYPHCSRALEGCVAFKHGCAAFLAAQRCRTWRAAGGEPSHGEPAVKSSVHTCRFP